MTKEDLKQYSDIQMELASMKEDIKKTQDAIEKIISEGTVHDKVYGGLGGTQGFCIEGFPNMEYDRQLRILEGKVNRLRKKETDLMELSEKIEVFIDGIPNSRDRMILKETFINGKKQREVSNEIFVERSTVSKIISKYI